MLLSLGREERATLWNKTKVAYTDYQTHREVFGTPCIAEVMEMGLRCGSLRSGHYDCRVPLAMNCPLLVIARHGSAAAIYSWNRADSFPTTGQ